MPNRLCRICLKPPTSSHQPATVKEKYGKWTLGYMFSAVTTYKIEESEPKLICHSCKRDLVNCFSFRQRCGQTQALLLGAKLLKQKRLEDNSLNRVTKINGIDLLKSIILNPRFSSLNTQRSRDRQNPQNLQNNPLNEDEVEIKEEIVEMEDPIDLNGGVSDGVSNITPPSIETIEENSFTCDDTTLPLTPTASSPSLMEFDSDETVLSEHINCTYCHKKISSVQSLAWHLQKSHPEQKTAAECPYCKKRFFPDMLSLQHLNRCRKNPINVQKAKDRNYLCCSHCIGQTNWYKNEAVLRVHLYRWHRDLCNVQCGSCSKYFFRDLLKFHEKKCQLKNNSGFEITMCSFCGKEMHRRSLKSHIQRTHATEKYVCDLCSADFIDKRKLRTHMHEAHLNLKLTFTCRLCSARFDSTSKLAHHKRKVHPETVQLLRCTSCTYQTRDSGNLHQHLKTHNGDVSKKYVCETCGRQFIHLSKMKDHLATHSDQRSQKCLKCDKTFKRASDVKKHVLYSHSEKEYECPVCLVRFSTNQNMRMHCTKHHPNYQLPPPGTVLKKNSKYKYSVLMTPVRERTVERLTSA